DRDLVGVERALRAESDADVASHQVDLVRPEAEDLRDPVPRAVGALGGEAYFQAAVSCLVGEDAARLHGDRGDPLAGHPLADRVGGVPERGTRVAGGEALAEGDVTRRVFVQPWGCRVGGVEYGGDRGEVVVVDDDELGGVG